MPDFTEDQEVLSAYTAETSDLLLSLALILRELDRNPQSAAQYHERLDQIIHTIQGSSAVMGAETISLLISEVEQYLHFVRQGARELDSSALHLLLDLTLELSTYLEETFPAPFAGEEWRARLSALTATPAQSVPTKEVGTAPAGDKDGGAQGETWVRPHLLPPFLAALRELTATLEAMLALYRQGTNALSDWDQLGQSLAKATELNAALRRQALQLHLVPVSLLIQRLAAESGLPGEIENDNGFEAELTGETAAKLVPPLAALIKGLGWTQAGQPDPLDAVKTPKPFLVRAERVGEFLTLKVKRGNAPGSGANRENQLVPDELSPIEAAIAEVQGRLKLDPTGGWFCLTVPVLPATIRSVIFQIGKEEYALPARNYLYHLTIKQQEVWESGGFTFLYRYPQVIPLLFTPNLSPSLDREEQDLTLALIEVGRIRFGLPVTKVEGYQELLRTDSDRPVVKGPFSFAKTYRPNGRLVLLADPNELAGLIPEY